MAFVNIKKKLCSQSFDSIVLFKKVEKLENDLKFLMLIMMRKFSTI